jgi:protein LTV1
MGNGESRQWALPQPELYGRRGEASADGATGEADDDGASEGSIEDHPFFDGLKAKPKEEQWDAETILTTYTTTDNHPTTVRVARKPRAGAAAIMLDKRTGLPVRTMLPAEEERRRNAPEPDDGGSDDDVYVGSGVNAGVARPKNEAADDKRARKAAAKAAKADRRQEKKGSKEAFREERAAQLLFKQKSTTLLSTSLSRWG